MLDKKPFIIDKNWYITKTTIGKIYFKYVLLKKIYSIYYAIKKFYWVKIKGAIDCDSPIHDWFELSYAQYLTIPRSVLQSMPIKWQKKFVKCLEELDDSIEWRPEEGRYWVQLKDAKGRYKQDPFMEYRHSIKIKLKQGKNERSKTNR